MQDRLLFLRSAAVVKILVKNITGIVWEQKTDILKACPSDTKTLLCFTIHNFGKLYVNVVKCPVIIKKKKGGGRD